MSRFNKMLKYGAIVRIDTDLLLSVRILSRVNSNTSVHLSLEELVELADYLQSIRPQLEVARLEFLRQRDAEFDERIKRIQEGNIRLQDAEESQGSC